jgi:hypothetical protein
MRTYAISPVIAAAARKARVSQRHAVGIPLYLPAPGYDPLPVSGYVEFDADDLRVDALDAGDAAEEDDDFY